MSLSAETTQHLRDEAYAFLCREAIEQELTVLRRERETHIDSCPPFAPPEGGASRHALSGAMRSALAKESGLGERLQQLSQIERRLHAVMHFELDTFLGGTSEEYARFVTAQRLFAEWGRLFRELQGGLLGFADEIRELVRETTAGTGVRDLARFIALREHALQLEQHVSRMDAIAHALVSAVPPDCGIVIPTVPDFRRVSWINQIFALPAPQLAAETARVETETRLFLAAPAAEISPRIQAGGEECQQAAESILQSYWNQLRAHAQVHYVEERDLDEVIKELQERYLASASETASAPAAAAA